MSRSYHVRRDRGHHGGHLPGGPEGGPGPMGLCAGRGRLPRRPAHLRRVLQEDYGHLMGIGGVEVAARTRAAASRTCAGRPCPAAPSRPLIADFHGRENNQSSRAQKPLISRGFRHLRPLAVDCFLGPKRPGRLRIYILSSMTVPMDFARFPRVFKALAKLGAASTLSRPRFWLYAPRRFRAGK